MYTVEELKTKLQRILKYVENKSYRNDADREGGLTYRQWVYAIDDAVALLNGALDVFEGLSNDLNIVVVEVIEVDLKELEREALKSVIRVEDIQGLLPFQTGIVSGENFFHVVNESLYDVETKHHIIQKGSSLCARGINGNVSPVLGPIRGVYPTCPGCVAKSKNIIARHVQNSLDRVSEFDPA